MLRIYAHVFSEGCVYSKIVGTGQRRHWPITIVKICFAQWFETGYENVWFEPLPSMSGILILWMALLDLRVAFFWSPFDQSSDGFGCTGRALVSDLANIHGRPGDFRDGQAGQAPMALISGCCQLHVFWGGSSKASDMGFEHGRDMEEARTCFSALGLRDGKVLRSGVSIIWVSYFRSKGSNVLFISQLLLSFLFLWGTCLFSGT